MTRIKVDDRVFKSKMAKMLQGLKPRSSEQKNLLKLMGIAGTQNIEDHFKKEAGPNGAWTPLALKTLESRVRGRRGNKWGPAILRDTGLMWRMNTDVKTNSVRVGSSAEYAERHNFGNGVPKREWAYIDTGGAKKIKLNIDFYIKKITGFKRK